MVVVVLGSLVTFFFGLSTGSKGWFLFCFFLGFFVRLVPEVLSYPYPVGFDTVYYAFRLKEGVIWFHWSKFFFVLF